VTHPTEPAEEPDGLNPKAWEAVNEAVGDALGVPPPDPVEDRPPLDAPPHGTSPAQLVPLAGGEITAQPKVEENGVRYQRISAEDLRLLETQRRLQQLRDAVDQRNREAAARAHPAFRKDGSLLGEYAPLGGDANTPDTVDGIWWLTLPMRQAIWELGLTSELEYVRVYRDIEAMAYLVENRRRQTGEYVPMVIKRRKRRENADLFWGGRVTRIRPMTDPGNVPRRWTKPHG